MSDPKQKVNDFILKTIAFEHMPDDLLVFTKNKLVKGEWKVYRFDAKVIDDEGFEGDYNFKTGDFYATYCWYGSNEYCATSPEFFEKMVSKTYKSIGTIVFTL